MEITGTSKILETLLLKLSLQERLSQDMAMPSLERLIQDSCELEFAEKYIKNSNLIDLVKANYEVIPEELAKTGKISNPWPNVDAGSGALL